MNEDVEGCERILREMVAFGPMIDDYEVYTRGIHCFFCNGQRERVYDGQDEEGRYRFSIDVAHEQDCLWLRAQAVVKRLDGE